MKIKIADSLIAILFVFGSLESLLEYGSIGVVSILLALFYFISGFVVFRAYPWARYLLYINAALLLLIVAIGLYITNFKAWHIGTVPLLVSVLFAVYGYYRYRTKPAVKAFKKEVLLFVGSLVVFCVVALIIDHLVVSSSSLSGPIRLK